MLQRLGTWGPAWLLTSRCSALRLRNGSAPCIAAALDHSSRPEVVLVTLWAPSALLGACVDSRRRAFWDFTAGP